ncbi:MAG: TonB-dependent receptor [Calditrichaeota bacterium]|nr:TonB-dependent receptor [Calditrichota bacterium]
MRYPKFFLGLAVTLMAIAILSTSTVFGGTTGKVAGIVKDAETGDPLPGANIILERTTLGSATDVDGYYFIINVPPGRYTLRATMMGYKTQKVKIQINVDLTTKINFSLTPTVMDLGTSVVVTAERPLIEPEVTSKRATVTADMIENMPVRSVQDIMALQSGVIMMEQGNKIAGFETRGIDQVHVRGGRSGEIAYMVDGMYVEDAIYAGMGTSVNREAIQELTTIIGAFDAEYGEAQSAVVNIVTKEGASSYHMSLEYNTSEITGLISAADDVRNAHQIIGSFGGPIPLIKNMSFFLSGEQSYGAYSSYEFDNHVYDPTPIKDIINNPNDPRYQKIADQIEKGIITEVDNIKQLRNNNDYYYVGDVLREWSTGAWRKAWRYRSDWDNDGFNELIAWDNFAGWKGLGWRKNWDFSGKLSWRVSPNIKIMIPLRMNRRVQQSWQAGWQYAMQGRDVLDDRTDQQTFIFTHQLSPKLFYEIRASRFFKGRSYTIHGINGHRLTPGHADEFSDAYRIFYDDPSISVDFGPQEYPTRISNNGFYVPMTFVRYDTMTDGRVRQIYRGAAEQYWNSNFQQSMQFKADVTWQAHRYHQFKMGAEYKTFGWGNKLFGKDVGGIRFLEYQYPWTRGYPSFYHLKPEEAAAYIQDKMDFKNFIVNLGVRVDYANSKGKAWKDWQDPTSGVEQGKRKYQISPRIGVGHPITDRATFHFNYGHFFQVPDYRDLYTNQNLDLNAPSPFFGWAHMDAQRTISYEMGVDYQFSDFWKFTVAAWAKENNGNAGSFRITGFDPDSLGGYSYGIITNNDFGSSKGIDLSVEKRPSDNYFLELQYTYSVAKANQYYSWAGYWEGNTAESRAKKEYLYRYDTPHLLTGMFGFQFTKGQGPTLFGFKVLENFLMQFNMRIRSGYPYTPSVGGQGLEPNTARRPMVYNIDAVFRRDFYFGNSIRAGFIARITNLFNIRNVLQVYSETGSPSEPNPGYSKTNYSTNWDTPWHWSQGRRIDFGLRMEF